jgi:biopolymer transport protein ExbB
LNNESNFEKKEPMNKNRFILIALVFLGSSPFASLAQDQSKTPSLQITEELSLLDFLMKGGFFLIPIVILLFYTLVISFEKFRYIRRVSNYNKNILSDIKGSLLKGETKETIDQLKRENNAVNSVLIEGVSSIGRPIVEIESNMDKMVNIEVGKMEKTMGHLGLIAGIAPTLGFIGTISGVIKIFYSISVTENVSIGNISAGLYEKMISSGSGLVVGMVAYAAYHLINGMIDSYVYNIQKINLEFINILQRPNHGDKA